MSKKGRNKVKVERPTSIKKPLEGLSTTVPSLKLTASSHLKMDGWNTTFLLRRPIFRGYVNFREDKYLQFFPPGTQVPSSSFCCPFKHLRYLFFKLFHNEISFLVLLLPLIFLYMEAIACQELLAILGRDGDEFSFSFFLGLCGCGIG